MKRLPAGIRPWQAAISAALLLAAVALVVLGRPGPTPAASTPAPATAAATTAPDASVEPIVSPSTARVGRGGLVGTTRNPFKPARKAREARRKAPAKGAGSSAGTPTTSSSGSGKTLSSGATGGGSGSGGSPSGVGTPGGAPGSTGPAATPTPTPTPTPTSTPDVVAASTRIWRPVVRFGATDGALRTRRMSRLQPVPATGTPDAVLAGLRPDHQTAVFVVAPDVGVKGGGTCYPSASRCDRLALRTGDIAFLTTGTSELRLELRRIGSAKVTAAAGRRSREAVATGGREALRSLFPQVGDLRYDARTGVLSGGLS